MSVVALVGAALPAVAANPNVPTGFAFERAVSHTPVLAAVISDPDGGAVSGKFFARLVGASTWNLVNGTSVGVTSGQVARLMLPPVAAGASVQWSVQGCDGTYCSPLSATQTGVVAPLLGAGNRKGATTVPFRLGERVQAKVDVGTGNLLVTTSDLSVLGVGGELGLGLAYNSAAMVAPSLQAAAGNPTGYGWTQTVGFGVRVQASADGSVIFWGPAGSAGTFVPAAVAGTFIPPAGVTADLVAVAGGGWRLTDHASAQKLTFDAAGVLLTIADRNDNVTTIAYAAAAPTRPTSFVGSAGPADARTITVTYAGTRMTGLSQVVAGGLSRTVGYEYNAAGDLVLIRDPLAGVTNLVYGADHLLSSVSSPGAVVTRFTYDAQKRVVSVRQVNTSAGSPGDSWTRLAYPSLTEVRVSDGAQEQVSSPNTAQRTTYTLTADRTGRVASVIDAAGRARAASYTPNQDIATATAGAGAGASTTTNTYGANSGESLTGQVSPGGSTRGWEYANTDPATKYLPSSSTDSAGNKGLYTYNGAGNPLTSSDALAAQAALTTNPNGTVATATAPGNGTNTTTYGYNTLAQMTSITAPTGTSLGVRAMTYDAYGRPAAATNGAGVTTTTTYDKNDRVLGVDYSGTTRNPDVAFTYDAAGRTATRADAAGTTTYGYDQMSRLTSRVNSADAKTITYGYDKASRVASTTDARGTTVNAFDVAGAQTSMTYNAGAATQTTRFATDDKGRRTDTWMLTNADNTVWAAHSHTDYDPSGRPARIWADRNAPSTGGGAPVRVTDLSYCYAAGSIAPACSAAPGVDRAFVQWMTNTVTGQVATYTYDAANRLTGAQVTAGTGPGGAALAPVTYAYTYDARGNRTNQTITTGTGPGATTVVQDRTANAGNQTTTAGFAYDGAGNLTADPVAGAITYTAGDQMASVTKAGGTTATYTYAGVGNGELISQTLPTGATYKLTYGRQNAIGKPVIEQVAVANGTAFLENDAAGTPIMIRTSAGQQALYVYDNLGSPVALITSFDTTAFVYSFDPFGAATRTQDSGGNGTPQTPFLYTGGLNDRTTGWTLDGARYYNPTEGRWTQNDTLDTPLDPTNANRYTYAANNPTNNIDPTGRSACTAAAGLAGVFHSVIWGAAASAAFTGGASLVAGAVVSGAVGLFWFGISEFGCE